MGWLYALHVRSALARGRSWQAAYMLDCMREQLIAMACARHGLPADEGRGVDQLPRAFTDALADTRASNVEPDELHRAFVTTTRALLAELAQNDIALAARLKEPTDQLTRAREPRP